MQKKKSLNVTMWQNNTNIINFDDVTKENTKGHNPNWPQIPDHPHRTLITGGSRSGKQIHYLL